jgi:IS5 family transposase
MMGPIQENEPKLFQYGVSLEKRVRTNNPLRGIARAVDFGFVREEVQDRYGSRGHKSEDPIVIMKLMLLLFLDDQPSERELMKVVGERLDYLWFLGFDLEDEIPNHSVLSKARRRWGREVFEKLFIRTVQLCVESGQVEGKKLHMDGTLINGSASKESVRRGPAILIEQLRNVYRAQEAKLDEEMAINKRSPAKAVETKPENDSGGETVSPRICSRATVVRRKAVEGETAISTTDIDTAVVRKGKGDGARPRYKNHRSVDDRFGVITAMETTAGDVGENAKLMDLVNQHEKNTGCAVETVVADAQYGTSENFAACNQRGIRSHMADLKRTHKNDTSRVIFGEEKFQYDGERDVYRCPAGESLKRQREDRGYNVYGISGKICNACLLRQQCTRSKMGRTLKRHSQHERVQAARQQSHSGLARQDRRRRRHLMEGSFADGANNHGLKRARWRGLVHQQTQDFLIAACQNIRILIRRGRSHTPAGAIAVKPERFQSAVQTFLALSRHLLQPRPRVTRPAEDAHRFVKKEVVFLDDKRKAF